MKKGQVNLEEVLADRRLEDELAEVPVKDGIFKIVLIGGVILALAGFFQIFNLGLVKNSFYKRRALANMSDWVIIPSPRGIIKDRFETPLLENKAVVNAYLDINVLPLESNKREEILKKIGEILSFPESDLKERIQSFNWDRSRRMLLKARISHEEILNFSSLNLPGVVLIEGLNRFYQKPLAYSHLLGYVGLVDEEELSVNPALSIEDTIGKSGLEAYYDSRLRGINGKEIFLRSAQAGVLQRVAFEKPVAGQDLETFIDGPLQEFFYERLGEELRRLGRRSGAGLVINPQNGEVLAMVSFPGFDPDRVVEFLNDPHLPLFNRVVSGLYNPGSTIKPLVAAAALKEGVITPEKQIYSAGYLEITNPYNPSQPSRFLDWKPHGWVDVYSALARSSNVYFYEVGGGFPGSASFPRQTGLGIERLKKWWQKFGLADKTGIDLPGEAMGFLPDPDWKEKKTGQPWRLGDTYNISIGQGDLSVTPLELLNYISAIANGGKLYRLRVAKDRPVEILKDLSEELKSVLNNVRQGMEDAVSQPYGTAYILNDLPVRVAAKTGTAQIQNNEKINAFFVGYLPTEALAAVGASLDKQIAVLVLVEDAREGSLNTIPIAKDIFLWYYQNRLVNNHG